MTPLTTSCGWCLSSPPNNLMGAMLTMPLGHTMGDHHLDHIMGIACSWRCVLMTTPDHLMGSFILSQISNPPHHTKRYPMGVVI
ncbi:unnamed protein product [Linum trigynum]|uniref:Uncharacterized protein n=1 Tax=Linum trigynum TaxID=586398 RepID=A0AAV2EEK9_9ROSI